MKKRNLLIQCPFCGCTQEQEVEFIFDLYSGYQVMHCAPFNDGGGCDNYFVIEVKLGPTFKTYELKEIKGEDIPLYE